MAHLSKRGGMSVIPVLNSPLPKTNGREGKVMKVDGRCFLYIWLFPKIVVPPKHPKMIIFSRKTPWLLGTTILGNHHIHTYILINSNSKPQQQSQILVVGREVRIFSGNSRIERPNLPIIFLSPAELRPAICFFGGVSLSSQPESRLKKGFPKSFADS